MIHNQERAVQNIETKFRSDYPQAAHALDQLTRRWNDSPSRCTYWSRYLDEFGEAVDNGSSPEISMTVGNEQVQATDRFYFLKEHDWTWVDITFDVYACWSVAGTYNYATTYNFRVYPTFPGDFTTAVGLTTISPGWFIGQAAFTWSGTWQYKRMHGRQICRAWPYDPASYGTGASNEAMGRFPRGKYGVEGWMDCTAMSGSEDNRFVGVNVQITEIPPTPLIADPES